MFLELNNYYFSVEDKNLFIKYMPRKAKKCPVGLVCFRMKVRHIALLILLLSVFFIFLVNNKKKNSSNLQSNFKNIGNNIKKTKINNTDTLQKISKLSQNLLPKKKNSNQVETNSTNNSLNLINKEINNDENDNNFDYSLLDSELNKIPETTNITINYQIPNDTSTSTYLVNKDYERVINPLEPPERRNFFMQSSGLERVVSPPGVPINIPTRGYSGGVMQVGILHKEDVTDDTKRIGQNTEPVILPLFGRPTYNGSNKWSYYTSTDKMNQIKIPISNKNRVCNSEYGCDELYDGDTVNVPAYNGDFKVSIYEFDKPRYIPYV